MACRRRYKNIIPIQLLTQATSQVMTSQDYSSRSHPSKNYSTNNRIVNVGSSAVRATCFVHVVSRVHGILSSLQTSTSHPTRGNSGKGGRAVAGGQLLGTIGEAPGHRSAQTEKIRRDR